MTEERHASSPPGTPREQLGSGSTAAQPAPSEPTARGGGYSCLGQSPVHPPAAAQGRPDGYFSAPAANRGGLAPRATRPARHNYPGRLPSPPRQSRPVTREPAPRPSVTVSPASTARRNIRGGARERLPSQRSLARPGPGSPRTPTLRLPPPLARRRGPGPARAAESTRVPLRRAGTGSRLGRRYRRGRSAEPRRPRGP